MHQRGAVLVPVGYWWQLGGQSDRVFLQRGVLRYIIPPVMVQWQFGFSQCGTLYFLLTLYILNPFC